MDYVAFCKSLDAVAPPDMLGGPLVALWQVAKGNWDEAHNIVQDDPGKDAAWVHAYLHRLEGDSFNARYWYQRAGKPAISGEFEREWKSIVSELLDKR